MPMYKRKRSYSKSELSSVKRRLTYPSIPRPRMSSSSFANFFRSVTYDLTIPNGTAIPLGFAANSSGVYINDNLQGWPGATEISAAFDAYRITKLSFEFTYNQNTSNVNQSQNTLPWLYTATDYDDAGGAGGLNISPTSISQKDGCRLDNFGTNGGNKIIRTFVPKIAVGAYATTLATGYMEPKALQWVSTGTLGTGDPKHYGLWAYIDDLKQGSVTGSNGYLRVFVKAWFQMKHSQ